MSTTDVKSNLAKLLATENLTVEHANVPTASFNVDTRVLYLPIWDNITDDIYDLLVGHEVGHAIYTPRDYEVKQDFPRSYLNVVEDARIERLMKQKYPGLSKSFFRGYTELNDRDFFEIEDIDVSKMSLIDRINLHFKIGIHNVTTIIPFIEEEKQFVDMTAATQTFDDVIEVCKKITEYLRDKKKGESKVAEVEQNQSEVEQPADYIDDGERTESELSDLDTQDLDDIEDTQMSDLDGDESDEDGDEELDEDELEESSTDRAWSRNQSKLIDQNCKPRLYLTPPVVNWDDHIVTIEKFSADMDSCKESQCETGTYVTSLYESWKNQYIKFKKESNKSVSYLVKEFEMKKRADEYSRSTVSKTGVIDTNKLFSYQWSEDIFKKTAVVPTGKNHGLIMYVDWSGSMSNSLEGTIKQLINLISFCKKVNIPFQVFAFNDTSDYYDVYNPTVNSSHNEINVVHKFRLVELFNSDLNSSKSEAQMIRLWNLMKMITHGGLSGEYRKYELGSTPLNESIFAAIHVFKNFKKKYKVDKVNTVFLTDGESNHLQYSQEAKEPKTNKVYYRRKSIAYVGDTTNVCLKDPKTGYVDTNICGNSSWNTVGFKVTSSLLKYYKWITGSNVIGFRLAESMGDLKYILRSVKDESQSTENKYRKDWKENKCFVVTDLGYDELYVIESSSEFKGQEASITVKSNSTKNAIRNQFRKYVKTKMLNKVILSKFVDQIA